jgi:hypothetical protein
MVKRRTAPTGLILSEDRDVPLLIFLWKWKLATTAALAARFYPPLSPEGAYRRLWRLERMHMIREQMGESRRHATWALGPKGYLIARAYLPELREEGYKSEHVGHDLLASAVHLGDWNLGEPSDVQLFSEQQLRRYSPQCYPPWVPTDEEHRPDGYWNLPHGAVRRTIALEVELSRQRPARYRAVAGFYSRNKNVIRVLWIAKSERSARAILRYLTEADSGASAFHDFALVDGFLAKGWGAQVVLGPDAETPMRNLLVNAVSSASTGCDRPLMLDTRKSPHRSGRCRPITKADFGV